MTVWNLHEALSERWPKSLSAPWDNDGILISADPAAQVGRILISLDADARALSYAAENGFDLLLTHHPALFRDTRTVLPDTVNGRRVIFALRHGISVISLHTRLDAGPDGVNETLCRLMGAEPSGTIGAEDTPGIARFADVPETDGKSLARLVKERLGAPAVRVTGDLDRPIRRIGFCGGDGKDLIGPALEAGCDAFVTGDAGYNAAEDAAELGLLTVEAGHFHSENPVCRVLLDAVTALCGRETELFDSCAYQVI